MLEQRQPVASSSRHGDSERELAELKGLRLLVGSLAHDFNNLLTAISGHAALLEADSPPGTDTYESATAILKAAEHAAAIAEKLQGIARRGKTYRVPVNIHETIAEVAALMRPAANGNIEILQNLKAPNPMTLGDPEQIHQVMLNLAINARDSMPNGGCLTFETAAFEAAGASAPKGSAGGGDRRLMITVRDTGRGISKEDQRRIFEPFFTTRQSGTGLGLSMVASIVKKHRGIIAVESKIGHGSAFHIYLPLLSTSEAP